MSNNSTPCQQGRAWIEIDLDALAHNIADIRSKIPKSTGIMAVVKANAYGHGVEKVAERMICEGVKAFAVTSVVEGVQLREVAPDSTILVMGYTHPGDARWLYECNLSQLVVDDIYAKALNDTGYNLRVHVAIDTGMNRLGVESSNFEEVEKVFKYADLTVEGIATHLSSPDGQNDSDTGVTRMQIESFMTVVCRLKEKGYNVGKLHAMSSYGIFNYPEFNYDYVRPGIMLYGVHSIDDKTKVKTELRPVLSLKAIVAQVRRIKAGESVSYGRTFTAEKPMKIATVSIGYADGFPRQISGNGGMGIVNGIKAPVVGRVCMDMIMLDVTAIEQIKAGDTVTLIGKDGNEEIRCEEVAKTAGTITNDILSGLSSRLPRIYR
ncbi:MAG: serine racemase VanT catalytic subunit [Oscillospiraceae bacterium]|nr:serine racemase VanT catalytic subunit [Oscillospiraceae bacterium]